MRYLYSKCIIVLIFGILGIHSVTDPFANQPQQVVRDGYLAVSGGYNRNVTILTRGGGQLFFNNQNLNSLGFGGEGGTLGASSLLLSANDCSSNPCRNGGTCVDAYNGYVCNCPSNWEGSTCESDVNECALYAGTAFGCQNGATCTNLPGSYRCDCTTNWFGIHCAEQHDDCTVASHLELCGHGTCVNEKRVQPGQPKYRCICEPGWTRGTNGPACVQDVDECSESEPKCSVNPRVQCFNLPGTFYCGPCPAGYTGNGLWCEDTNECEVNNGGCSINPFVECYNTPGSRRCGPCPNGYFGNGEQCMYQSVCDNNRGGCHPLATCIDNPAITMTYRECRCPPGYVGNGEGLTGCVPTPQGITCDNNPCLHGTCQMAGNSYHCICNAGYYGTNCEIAEDPCRFNPCLNGGTCSPGDRQLGTFSCSCATGYSGPTCDVLRRGASGILGRRRREIRPPVPPGQYGPGCGGTTYMPRGNISSPNYPSRYSNDVECVWTIQQPSGYLIKVEFVDIFDLEQDEPCSKDYVQLDEEGEDGSWKLIRKLCGSVNPGTLVTTGNTLRIIFHTNDRITGDGFMLVYSAHCGGVLTSPTGRLTTSAAYFSYNVETDCKWRIIGQSDRVIQLRLLFFDLEPVPSYGCQHLNSLKVYDGNETGRYLGIFCGEGAKYIKSTGSEFTLRFQYKHWITKGFSVYYYNTYGPNQGCGKTFLNATRGELGSLDYDNDGFYELDLDCFWMISVGRPDEIIKITFQSFDLQMPSNGSCDYDYVELRDMDSKGPMIGRYCGNTLPSPIRTNAERVFVHFHSDDTESKSGFRLSFEVEPSPCGTSVLTATYEEQSLQSVNYPNAYPSELSCKWTIVMNESRSYTYNSFHLSIVDIDIPCGGDYLEVKRTILDNADFGLIRYCGNKTSQVFSFHNPVLVTFNSDSINDGGRGFKIIYKLTNCNRTYTSEYGTLSTVSYPGRPVNGCLTHITAADGKTIALYFFFNKVECNRSSIEVYDGNSESSPLLGNFCGKMFEDPVFSTGNEMLVKAIIIDDHGWYRATYLTTDKGRGCGGSITASEGALASPLYPQPYNVTGECLWFVSVPSYHTVNIYIWAFALTPTEGCNANYLEIYEGSSPDIASRIVKYCGQDVHRHKHKFRSNEVVIKLVTDATNNQSGFYLNFVSSDHVPKYAATNFVQNFDLH